MPQPTKGPRLGGSPAHQKLMLANLATSLFTHGKIHTTRAKAERLRPYAERLITKAKRGDLHNRRMIAQVIRDKDVLHRLMAEIGPFFADRPGGYTRIVKTLPRRGDNAPMAIIELVNERTASAEAGQATRVAAQPATTTAATTTGATATGATAAGASATDTEPTDTASADTSSTPATTEELGGGSGATTTPADTTPADTTPADTTAATTQEVGGGSGATTGAVEAGSADDTEPAEVPEPMAENAADSAGLSTDSGSASSSDQPEDRS